MNVSVYHTSGKGTVLVVTNTVTRSMPDPAPVGTLLVAAGRFRLASHRSTPSNRANSRLFQDMRSCGARNDLGG